MYCYFTTATTIITTTTTATTTTIINITTTTAATLLLLLQLAQQSCAKNWQFLVHYGNHILTFHLSVKLSRFFWYELEVIQRLSWILSGAHLQPRQRDNVCRGTVLHAQPTKPQMSCASAQADHSSLSAWRRTGSLTTHKIPSEDSDQTTRMRSLIRVFAGHSCILIGNSCRGSYYWTGISAARTFRRPAKWSAPSSPREVITTPGKNKHLNKAPNKKQNCGHIKAQN